MPSPRDHPLCGRCRSRSRLSSRIPRPAAPPQSRTQTAKASPLRRLRQRRDFANAFLAKATTVLPCIAVHGATIARRSDPRHGHGNLTAARLRRIFRHSSSRRKLSHKNPGMTGIIPACRSFAKDRYQVEIIASGAFLGRYRFATKVRAPLAWFFVSRGRGCLRETPDVVFRHAWHRTYRRTGVALQPGPTVRFPVPGVRKRRGNNHGDPPHATSDHPAEACRDACRPPDSGPVPWNLCRIHGSEGLDTGSAVLFPIPRCTKHIPRSFREVLRCGTLALPRQDYRSHTAAAYAATASAPFFPGSPGGPRPLGAAAHQDALYEARNEL